eukprot:10526536-Lingulodinium_polyedra.AAC.1
MPLRIFPGLRRRRVAEDAHRARARAEEQQQPCALRSPGCRNAFEERLLLGGLVLQPLLHEISVPD